MSPSTMSAGKLTIAVLVVILAQISPSSAAFASIRTVTGRLLPQEFHAQYFPKRSISHISNALYEIIGSEMIVSHTTEHDISSALKSSPKIVHPNPSTTVRLNGIYIDSSNDPVMIHTDKETSISVHLSSKGNILAVHILYEGLSIIPVDAKNHPGLFYSLDESPSAVHSSIQSDYAENLKNAVHRSSSTCKDKSNSNAKAVKIAIAFDSQYCLKYSSENEAIASINSLIADVSAVFEASTCLRPTVSHIDANCEESTDPYRSLRNSNSDTILDEFVAMWRNDADKINIKRDVAFFVSGFDDGTSTAGRAYVGVVCSMDFGYGWSEGNSPTIFAHELGHTFDASHDSSGLMKATLSSSQTLEFSSNSINEIVAFVDRRATCLESIKEGNTKPSPPPTSSPMSSDSKTLAPSITSAPMLSESSSPTPSKSSVPMPSDSTTPVSSDSSSPVPSESITPIPNENESSKPAPIASSSSVPSGSIAVSPVSSRRPTKTPSSSPLPSESKMPKPSPTKTSKSKPSESAKPSKTRFPASSRSNEAKTPSPSASISYFDEQNNDKKMDDENDTEEPKTTPSFTNKPSISLMPFDSPTGKPGTCGSLFTPTSVFSCTQRSDVGRIETSAGAVKLTIRQRLNLFEIRLIVQEEEEAKIKIIAVALRFSMKYATASTTDVQSVFPDGDDTTNVVDLKFDPAGMNNPSFGPSRTCCGEQISLSVGITVRREEVQGSQIRSTILIKTAMAFGDFEAEFKCNDPCRGQEGKVFTTGDLCPVCEMV